MENLAQALPGLGRGTVFPQQRYERFARRAALARQRDIRK
jgi:hypothetical protein